MSETVVLRRSNRIVVATGPSGGPPPAGAAEAIAEDLTYYEKQFSYETYGESGNRTELIERKLYMPDPNTGAVVFAVGLTGRITNRLKAKGFDVVRKGKTLLELDPTSGKLDWDGLFADFTIYPGQDVCLSRIISAESGGVVSATVGSGKSVIIRMICRLLYKSRIHIVTKSATLADEIYKDISAVIPDVGFCGKGKRKIRRVTVFIADSLQHGQGDADVLLGDECFVAGTKVSIPGGERDIDLVQPGDVVHTAHGVGTVERVICKPALSLVRVNFDDGQHFVCTPDHPVFTDRGWLAAENLVEGALTYGTEGVRFLWENDETLAKGEGLTQTVRTTVGAGLGTTKNLLSILCEEIREPDEQTADASEAECQVTRDPAQTHKTRWQRAIATLTAAGAAPCSGGGLGVGSCDQDQAKARKRVPDSLQTGSGTPGEKDRNRDRREHAQQPEGAREGCQESEIPGTTRVVCVSRVKQGSSTPVFNLRVSGHPSYFANGKLVHNCHELMAPKYTRLLGMYDRARFFGFSATPTGRMDGRDAEMEGLFGPILYTLSYQDAEAMGRVVPITVEWLRVPDGPDVSSIKSPAIKEKYGIWHNQIRNQIIADRVSQFGPDEQVLVMVKTIEHAVCLRQMLPDFTLCYAANGMDSQRFDNLVANGLLPPDEPRMTNARIAHLRTEFAANRLKKVIANMVWSTGVNFRHLAVLARADAMSSEIRDGQIPGRVCRRVEGVKESALLIDCHDDWSQTYNRKALLRKANYRKRGWAQTWWQPANTSPAGSFLKLVT